MDPTTNPRETERPAVGGPRWFKPLGWIAGVGLVAALATVVFMAQRAGWTPPRFSALLGRGASPGVAWCAAHNVAAAECIECRPDAFPAAADYGWCKEHGITQCLFEHADVVQRSEPYTTASVDARRAATALALRPRLENLATCRLYQRRIQVQSTESLAKAGIEVDVVGTGPIVESVSANAEIVYDPTRSAHLSSRAPGVVSQVLRQVGDQVETGEVIALIDSAEVGRAKAELLAAASDWQLQKSALARIEPLAANGTLPARQLQEARAAVQSAEIRAGGAQSTLANLGLEIELAELESLDTSERSDRLRWLGVPQELLESPARQPKSTNLAPLTAPLAGEIVEIDLVAGEVVDTKTQLATVADIERMWLSMHIRESDAPHVKIGQTARFTATSGGAAASGKVTWISPAADPRTRTVEVRAELNGGPELRANTYGAGQIVLREETEAVVVPEDAVNWDGTCNIVFVRDKDWFREGAPKFFHVREVRPGVSADGQTEIIAGLAPGEVIATRNSSLLQAQLLKASLGAGCGCVD